MENVGTISTKKVRNSNIELLKIIAMILICISHVFINEWSADITLTTTPSLIPSNWLLTFFKNLGWVGDYIFIVCSCYFLIGYEKFNIKKVFTYHFDVALLYYIFYFVFLAFGLFYPGTQHDLTIKTFINITPGKFHWFVPAYLGFLLCVPFITKLERKMKQSHYKIVIASLIILNIGFYVGYYFWEPMSNFKFPTFFLVYFIMSYGKKFGSYLGMKENRNAINLTIALSSFALLFLFNLIGNVVCAKNNIIFGAKDQFCLAFGYFYHPIMLFITIPLFLFFLNQKPWYNKTVNYLSSLSIIFYIAHANDFIRTWANHLMRDSYLKIAGSFDFRPAWVLLFSLGRFVFGILVSIIFFETVHRLIVFVINKISEKIKTKKKTKTNE